MKTILFTFLFLLIPKLCISQVSVNDEAVYLDSLYNISTAENYKYISELLKIIKFQIKKSISLVFIINLGRLKLKAQRPQELELLKQELFCIFMKMVKENLF